MPTIVLLDRNGVVRVVHPGYAADLADTVGKEVESLISRKPLPAVGEAEADPS